MRNAACRASRRSSTQGERTRQGGGSARWISGPRWHGEHLIRSSSESPQPFWRGDRGNENGCVFLPCVLIPNLAVRGVNRVSARSGPRTGGPTPRTVAKRPTWNGCSTPTNWRTRISALFGYGRGSCSKSRWPANRAASFVGRFVPGPLLRPDLLPWVPDLQGLRFQVLHTDDAAQAYLVAVRGDVHGAFNLAAQPVIDASTLGTQPGGRVVKVPRNLMRTALSAAWQAHAVPASPYLFDAVLRLPTMDCGRARDLLGRHPTRTAEEALDAYLNGVRHGPGAKTRPLARHRVG